MCNAVFAATVLLIGISSAARADVTVGVADNGDCYPFFCNDSGAALGSMEYQQVYASSQFSGPMLINSETFYDVYAQMFGGSGLIVGGTYIFYLSTSSAAVNMLSTTLADNLGADNTEVLTYSVPAAGQAFSSTAFVNTTPFLYNPAAGNLLLDIQVSYLANGVNAQGNSYNDADDTGNVTSRAYQFNADPTTAVADSTGLVTTFGTTAPVPEPSAFFLGVAGLLVVAGLMRQALRGQTQPSTNDGN
jgi:hypothetical protein